MFSLQTFKHGRIPILQTFWSILNLGKDKRRRTPISSTFIKSHRQPRFLKFYADCNGKVIKPQSADYRAIMSGKRKDSYRRNPLH